MKTPPDSKRILDRALLKPRPGRAKEARAGKSARKFLNHIRALANQHHPQGTSGNRSFSGGSLGRGAVRPLPGRYAQRVIVKARIVRIASAAGVLALAAHLKYLVRDGVGLDGEEAKVFTNDKVLGEREAGEWVNQCADDRHQFRFIVSPEQGSQLDLEQYAKDLVRQMESDLKTRLDWIAVTHHDTDNPHIHLVVRGVDETGGDLVISRDYMSRGVRGAAQDLATRELGSRTEFDIQQQQDAEITQDRVTGIDIQLEKAAANDPDRLTDVRQVPAPGHEFAHRLRNQQLGRLQHLEALGLAEELSPGLWKIDESLTPKLRALGNRNDIIKLMHQKLRGIDPVDTVIFDKDSARRTPLTGKVVDKGLADELRESKYLLINAEDGKTYYVALSKFSETPGLESNPGAIVTVTVTGKQTATRWVSVKVESYLSLEDQVGALGPTWLDKQLAQGKQPKTPPSLVLSQFEAEKVANMQARLNRLQQMGLTELGASGLRVKARFLDELYRNELQSTLQRLSKVYGKPVTPSSGQSFTGTFERMERLASGPHAIINASNEFTVIPLQRVMERLVTGQTLSVEIGNGVTASNRSLPDIQQQRVSFALLEGADLKKSLGLGISL